MSTPAKPGIGRPNGEPGGGKSGGGKPGGGTTGSVIGRGNPGPVHDRAARQRAHRAGLGAEWFALMRLRLAGWRIIRRRFSVKGGEVDIIAQRGRTLAFVEVKYRADLLDAQNAVDRAKMRRIGRAARVFIARHGKPGVTYRADFLFLAPWRWPVHVAAAFELDLD